MLRNKALILAFALLSGSVAGLSAQIGQYGAGGDPPSRVGRLSNLSGSVSLYPTGAHDWSAGSINYPLSSGDAVWADNGGRAEVQLGASSVRIGAATSITFGEISDTVTQVRLDQGVVEVYVHDLRPNEIYEIDIPSGVISLTDVGRYRIDVTPDGQRGTLTVRSGSASFELDDGSYPVSAGSAATLINGQRRVAFGPPVAVDAWENWANSRDQLEDGSLSARFVTRDMVGYEDLDQYGDWQSGTTYGAVWYPRAIQPGWAPYRYGRWESIDPWGWTWIDDAPWGFAPFHYGRWANISGRWGWIPGTVRSRPVYAPALVAFIGGAGWSVSASFGGRPAVGWVPLGPQEPFIPAYRTSQSYVQRVNVTNVRTTINVTQINVNNINYVNRGVPGGVTAVSRDDFVGSRQIGRAAVTVGATDVARARPSAVPLAGDERLNPLPRGQTSVNSDRGGRGSGIRPATPPAAVATPTPPPQWRGRARPGSPPPAQGAPPQGTPPPVNPPPPDRGRGRQSPPPTTPPIQATPPATPPPATTIPPVQPPPDRGRGRGRPVQPPTTPPVNPPTQPPPPPDRGGRGRPIRPPTTPPVTPPPTQTPPTQTPPTQPPPPDRGGRGRARPVPPPPPVKPQPPPPPPPPPVKPPPPPPPPPPVKPPPPPSRRPPPDLGANRPPAPVKPTSPPSGRGGPPKPPDSGHVKPPPPPAGGGGGGVQLPAFTVLT